MCYTIFIQPFDTSIDGALFILQGDLFDFWVGRFLTMVKVVLAVCSLEPFKQWVFANEAEPVQ